ncbi:phosphomannomutase, partial [Pseudomonas aeruginosa]
MIDRYRRRYGDVFPPDTLSGIRVAAYQQSSVARDLLADLLAAFGAEVTSIGRSETFVPIDTEAHRPEDVA